MKKILLNSLLVAIMAMIGVNAWAAGYTRTLSAETQVSGYVANTFYNFQTNEPAVLPESGDLRYRSGNIWGLHNFGSGSRSATVNIPVTEGQLLVIQHYSSSNVSTITPATLNSALTAATGYECYEITADAENITVSIARYGGLVAALLMDKDMSAETAEFTVKYIDEEGNELKSETQVGVVGGAPAFATDNIWVDDVKYIYVDNDAEGMTVAADGSTVVTISFRKAKQLTLTVVDNWDNLIGTSTVYEGETAAVPYPRYKAVDGVLYQKPANDNEYKQKVNNITEDQLVTINYEDAGKANVVFLTEGEDIEGLSTCTGGTIDIRASNAKCGYNPNDEAVAIVSLSAGTYTITAHTVGNTDSSENWIMAGEQQVLNAAFSGNFGVITEEFTLNETTTLTIGKFGGSQKGLDLVYIQSENGNVTTAIQSIDAQAQQSAAIYNLAGQKVMKAQKGLYIMNGKKFVK